MALDSFDNIQGKVTMSSVTMFFSKRINSNHLTAG